MNVSQFTARRGRYIILREERHFIKFIAMRKSTWDDYIDRQKKHSSHWIFLVGYILIGALITIGIFCLFNIKFQFLSCNTSKIFEEVETLLIGIVPAYFAIIIAKTQEERDLASGIGIPQLHFPTITLIDTKNPDFNNISNFKMPPRTTLIGIFEFKTHDLYWRAKIDKLSLVVKTYKEGKEWFQETSWKSKKIVKKQAHLLTYQWKNINTGKEAQELTSRLTVFCTRKDEAFWSRFRQIIPTQKPDNEVSDELDKLGIHLRFSFQSGIIKTKRTMKLNLFFLTLPLLEECGKIKLDIIDSVSI